MNTWKLSSAVVIAAIAGFLWFQFSGSPAGPGQTGDPSSEQRNSQAGGQKSSQNGDQSGGPDNGSRSRQSSGPGSSQGGRPGGGGPGGGRPPALVVSAAVSEALINDRLKAVGSGRAAASVSVVPLSSGLLTEIAVSSGQRVEKGEVLARLDDDEQRIARDRAARTAEDAAIDEARLAKLYRSRTTTEVELNNARADLADAQLALREAELTLSRRSITAPISGVIGLVAVDTGNYVTQQTELVTIDDRSTLILDFWVPERFASQIALGQTIEATALANPAVSYSGAISGIGSRIETDSRTLPVQATVDNSTDKLRPGMSFDIQLNFSGEVFPAVDPLAVQWNASGAFVWKLVEDKVQRVPVRIIQRNPDSVLVQADLAASDSVIVEGLMTLRPGAQVRVQGAPPVEQGGNQSGNQSANQDGRQSNKEDGKKGENEAANKGSEP